MTNIFQRGGPTTNQLIVNMFFPIETPTPCASPPEEVETLDAITSQTGTSEVAVAMGVLNTDSDELFKRERWLAKFERVGYYILITL